jgi:hypothetical protein
MDTPLAIEFVRQGSDILLRMEEHDTERLILMNPTGTRPASYSALGYSTGRWAGASLIVETTNIDSAYMTIDGIPQSRAIRLTERFAASESGDRLDYTLSITDPEMFTEPFELTRYMVWVPEKRVGRFACEE